MFNEKSPARLTMFILRGHYSVQQKNANGNLGMPKGKERQVGK